MTFSVSMLAGNLAWAAALAGVSDAACQMLEERYRTRDLLKLHQSLDAQLATSSAHPRTPRKAKRMADCESGAAVDSAARSVLHYGAYSSLGSSLELCVPPPPSWGGSKDQADDGADEQTLELDWKRIRRFVMTPGLTCGFTSFAFYNYAMPWIVPNGASSLGGLVMMIGVDQIYGILARLMTFTINTYLDGGCWRERLTLKLQRDFVPSLLLPLWIPYDVVAFLFIPRAYQSACVKLVDVLAYIVCSFYINREVNVKATAMVED
eukprot:NODE_2682_length_1143_cov_14.346435_g2460_i0.p1 GENE.NODE_2682_length_1143_cov_14.346435_g2460_i0~~NODE_2682_length_1143_cov_14.346435_g2460_i0.p1  ORF type:complete len:265 (-),score=38.35 NODE_2682_length_1143_cov_14.346435_g2460_i0:156-950(-)